MRRKLKNLKNLNSHAAINLATKKIHALKSKRYAHTNFLALLLTTMRNAAGT